MPLELVVFDMAGTTVNDGNAVNDCVRAALAEAGLHVSIEAVNAVMGLPKPETFRRLMVAANRADTLLPQLDRIHADFVARMNRFYATDASVYPIAGAVETFRTLRSVGIQVALDTGFSRPIVDVILRRLDWRVGATIDAVIASDEVARGRPFPDMIRELMRRLHITDARQVAKVGDTPADLEEGTQAGCSLVIGVTRGTHTRAELAASPHTHLLETVADLPALLRTLQLLPG